MRVAERGEPLEHLGIMLRPRRHAQHGARNAAAASHRRLDIAYRDRQHALALRLDHAEAGRELDQRRLFVGLHGQRELGLVDQR
ncbi:hypothetical protein LP419_06705 [Massilia sp. H-1]|nr:hypothetical protein LP419_06705 [Massilia sp. H-1]